MCTLSCGWSGGHGVGREGAEVEGFLASPRSKSAGDPAPHQGPGLRSQLGHVPGCDRGQGPWLRLQARFHVRKLGTNTLLAGLPTPLPALPTFPGLPAPAPAFFSTGPSQRSTQSRQDLVTARSRQGEGRRQATGGHRSWGRACGWQRPRAPDPHLRVATGGCPGSLTPQ